MRLRERYYELDKAKRDLVFTFIEFTGVRRISHFCEETGSMILHINWQGDKAEQREAQCAGGQKVECCVFPQTESAGA